MNKHTPGPWMADFDCTMPEIEGPYHRQIISIYAGGDPICEASNIIDNENEWDGDNPLDWTQTEANARLISAAPELLKALERILYAHDTGNNGASMGEAVLCRAYADTARAAIAKATGG